MRRLRSFVALPPAERALSLRAVAGVFVAWMALRLLPFRTLRRWFDLRVSTVEPPARLDEEGPMLVRRALLRAQRTIPSASCLALALTAEWLLRRRGYKAVLTIGVSRAGAAGAAAETAALHATPGAAASAAALPLDAHAWVECGALVVTGDAEVGRYATLVRFGPTA